MKMTMKNGLQFFSFLNLLRAFGLAITQRVAANLSVVGWSARDRQRGASAIEYVMIIAVIVLAIAFAVTQTNLGPWISETFEELAGAVEPPPTNP